MTRVGLHAARVSDEPVVHAAVALRRLGVHAGVGHLRDAACREACAGAYARWSPHSARDAVRLSAYQLPALLTSGATDVVMTAMTDTIKREK
jgi:hypothetical protein